MRWPCSCSDSLSQQLSTISGQVSALDARVKEVSTLRALVQKQDQEHQDLRTKHHALQKHCRLLEARAEAAEARAKAAAEAAEARAKAEAEAAGQHRALLQEDSAKEPLDGASPPRRSAQAVNQQGGLPR